MCVYVHSGRLFCHLSSTNQPGIFGQDPCKYSPFLLRPDVCWLEKFTGPRLRQLLPATVYWILAALVHVSDWLSILGKHLPERNSST
jgi:hypothetical protein